MNLIGKRVRVKGTTTHPEDTGYVRSREGRTGIVAERAVGAYDWHVEDVGAFYTDELVILGGRHAGEPHPQNFEDVCHTAFQAENSVEDAEVHGWHAGPADYEAELDAWREHRDAL